MPCLTARARAGLFTQAGSEHYPTVSGGKAIMSSILLPERSDRFHAALHREPTDSHVLSTSEKDSIIVRLAGDSGDGVQLMGSQFIASTALSGEDFATFPDYPAEIRAPVGTTFGVSAYQMNIGANPITTAGDAPDVSWSAFNPAALKVSLPLLISSGALLVVNSDSFTKRNLAKAGYTEDPRDTGELDVPTNWFL